MSEALVEIKPSKHHAMIGLHRQKNKKMNSMYEREWLISSSQSSEMRKYPTLPTCVSPERGQQSAPSCCYCRRVRWLMDHTTEKKVTVVCWVTDTGLLLLGADWSAVAGPSNWASGWQKGSFNEASIMSVREPQRPDGSVRRPAFSSAEEAARMWWCRSMGYGQRPSQVNHQHNTCRLRANGC